jgi:hypothetical protein
MAAMTEPARPVPQRIGDVERDQAAEYLREHMTAGRLNAAEFDERLTAALSAKVQSDLDRLFVDLPSPTPQSPTGKASPPVLSQQPGQPAGPPFGVAAKTRHTIDLLVGLAWPVTIALCFIVGWDHWWLIFAPIVLTSVWEKKKQQDAAELKRWEREHRRLEAGDDKPTDPS